MTLAQWFGQRAPWYVSPNGRPVVGNWGETHNQLGVNEGPMGYVLGDGTFRVYPQDIEFDHHMEPDKWNKYEQKMFNQVAPAIKKQYGFMPWLDRLHGEDIPIDLEYTSSTHAKGSVGRSEPLSANMEGDMRRSYVRVLRRHFGAQEIPASVDVQEIDLTAPSATE